MHHEEAIDHFIGEGLITDVVRPLKSGKEAAVWLCRAHPSTGTNLAAAKVYHPIGSRAFRNDAMYKAGRVITKGRERRAMENKTRFGRQLDEGWWVSREYEALSVLSEAGADVPKPIARMGTAILMEFIGDVDGPAPQLRETSLQPAEARRLVERLMWNVELFLGKNLIHADLSAYNVLYRNGTATVIDFPQWVDPRTNPNAQELLRRDLENLSRHFARLGVRSDPERVARGLWMSFLFADLR
jgi:RIO kinase 1